MINFRNYLFVDINLMAIVIVAGSMALVLLLVDGLNAQGTWKGMKYFNQIAHPIFQNHPT